MSIEIDEDDGKIIVNKIFLSCPMRTIAGINEPIVAKKNTLLMNL